MATPRPQAAWPPVWSMCSSGGVGLKRAETIGGALKRKCQLADQSQPNWCIRVWVPLEIIKRKGRWITDCVFLHVNTLAVMLIR